MNLLIISQMLPNAKANHASAFCEHHMIRYLSERHRITLLSFVQGPEEQTMSRELKAYCTAVETVPLRRPWPRRFWTRANVLRGVPMAVSNCYSPQMAVAIRRLLCKGTFDVVQIVHGSMGQYVSEISRIPVILHLIDTLSTSAARLAQNLPMGRKKVEWSIDSLLLRRYEASTYRRFDHIVAISENMRDSVRGCVKAVPISVVRLGVHIPGVRRMHTAGAGRHIVFMGAMWRRENIESVLYFYRHAFGRICREVPDAVFHVVGDSPPPEVQMLAKDPRVRVTGYVEDLHAYYMQCDVSVAPMRIAGGVMCKILDAMAAGLPVVTTSQGNEGTQARADEHILIADDPAVFAAQTIRLLQDERLRQDLSDRALEFVRRRFSWSEAMEVLEHVYTQCVAGNTEKP